MKLDINIMSWENFIASYVKTPYTQ